MSHLCGWREFRRCVAREILPCIFVAGSGFAQSLPCSTAQNTPSCRALLVVVRVNGTLTEPFSDNALIAYEDADGLYLSHADLETLRIRTPGRIQFSAAGKPYLALRSVAGLEYMLSGSGQELDLKVQPSAFAGLAVDVYRDGRSPAPVSRGSGAFVNYDVFVQRSSRTAFGALAELATFSPLGLASSRFVRAIDGAGPVRLDSSFVHDFPSRRESLRIGDAVTPPGAWGRSLYFGGIQWGTDAVTQPSFVTFPQAAIHGEAVMPSVAELYVNQSLRWSQQVPAGPFEIRNPPLASGPGQFTLVVRDALGRDSTITSSYFASPRLLRRGLAEYSFSAGLVRNQLGVRNFAYGRGITTGYYRRGLTNRVTAEARAEVAKQLRTVGVSLIALVLPHVVATATAVQSQTPGQSGLLKGAGIEFQTRRFTAGGQFSGADAQFRQLGLDRMLLPPRQQLGANAGINLFRRDHLSAAYYRQQGPQPIHYALATYSLSLTNQLSLSLTGNRSLDRRREWIVFAGVNYQFPDRTNLNHSFLRNGNGQEAQIAVQRNLPLGKGSGYRVVAASGPNARVDATYTQRTEANEFQLQGTTVNGATGVRAAMRGAFALMRDGGFFTRQIDDGFAVVKVGSYSAIPVFFDNQEIAQTNSKGVALVPRLLSYQENLLSIDPERLPMNVSLGTTSARVKPARRAGVALSFPVQVEQSVFLRLVDASGNPIPAQARVEVEALKLDTTVGANGLVYFQDVKAPSMRIRVALPDGDCHAEWKRTEAWRPGVLEGPFVCAH